MTLNPGLTTELQKLAPSTVIELFELDATSVGGDILYFHAGTNEIRQNVVWNGNTYTRYPVIVSGFEFNGSGQFPRPKLKVSNIFSAITALVLNYNDLLGVKLTRRRTLAKFLDAVNFASGINANADPTAEFAQDIYFIDRKSNEDRDIVEFELCSAFDVAGIQLPRRQVIQNVCTWRYRGPECGYTGPPVFDINDAPIVEASTSAGKALLSARDAYLAAQANYDSAQSAMQSTSQQKDVACQYELLATRYDSNNYVYAFFAGSFRAFWNGSAVTLGSTYARGNYIQDDENGQFFEIQEWGVNSSSCGTATTVYNTAVSNFNTAQSNLLTAKTNYDNAFAALANNDPLYSAERCGKHLSSCQARFGVTAELPYGSFPAAGLTN